MTPTPKGRYILLEPAPYKTNSWPMSKIKWGTPLKESPADPEDVWYLHAKRQGKDVWASTKRDLGMTKAALLVAYSEASGKPQRKLPPIWLLNDFGPLAVRFFVDKNNNGRFDDGAEEASGAMFHTTPENELQPGSALEVSHGCIHMNPKDRDALIGMKVLRAGTVLHIHGYNEKHGTADS